MEDLGAPISYLVLKRGATVYSRDGERLGRVVRVSRDRKSHIFDGIVFDTTPRKLGGHKFVDAPEVEGIYERGVILTIDAATAAKLAEPGKNPGSIEVSPDDVAGEPEPSFWTKAWNRLSGKG